MKFILNEKRVHNTKRPSWSAQVACPYPRPIEKIRRDEYPNLEGTTYLDHAGTTPYPKSLMETFAKDMTSSLLGNPHSQSPSSMLSTTRIDSVRAQVLAYFKADPAYFDLVFVANATAAIKLVVDCMSDYCRLQGQESFRYTYHKDSHTSLVGPRAIAAQSKYLESDSEVEQWISNRCYSQKPQLGHPELFAYPAQSNMTGRRLPLEWCGRLRKTNSLTGQEAYSLLDAAAFVSTGHLDLSKEAEAPDFIALSFYKIFGFPDLGALIVRKKSDHVLRSRRYFGGGTVDMVVNGSSSSKPWHALKQTSLHDILEDGTPPFHSILALDSAMQIHKRLFGSAQLVSQYTSVLARILFNEMTKLTYDNGEPVCKIYAGQTPSYGDSRTQGPTIAFNMRDSHGSWIGKSEFETAAIRAGIQLRTGGVCNPGGIATALELSPQQMEESYAEGVRCGNAIDEMHGKPTGIVRVSLGAMSTSGDIKKFLKFLKTFSEDKGEKIKTRSMITSTGRIQVTSCEDALPQEAVVHSRIVKICETEITPDVISEIDLLVLEPEKAQSCKAKSQCAMGLGVSRGHQASKSFWPRLFCRG